MYGEADELTMSLWERGGYKAFPSAALPASLFALVAPGEPDFQTLLTI